MQLLNPVKGIKSQTFLDGTTNWMDLVNLKHFILLKTISGIPTPGLQL